MPATLRTLRRLVVGAISYRALFSWTTPPMFIGTLLVGSLLQLLCFVFLGRQLQVADDHFYLLGNTVLAASTACFHGGTMALSNERRYGTLGAVLLSPRHRAPLWIGRALPYVLNGLLISVFTLSAASLLLGLRIPVGALPGLGAVLVAGAAGCSAFGLALGALGLHFRDVFLVSNVAGSLLFLLTGANVPREVLPGWMRATGDVLPLTHAVEAARAPAASTGGCSGPSCWSAPGTGCSPCSFRRPSSGAADGARPSTSCDVCDATARPGCDRQARTRPPGRRGPWGAMGAIGMRRSGEGVGASCGGGVLFTRGSCGRCPGVAASPGRSRQPRGMTRGTTWRASQQSSPGRP